MTRKHPWLTSLPALILGPALLGGADDRKPATADALVEPRREMVAQDIAARGIEDEATLGALRSVPRHLFVPPAYESRAYDDRPLPIGYGQTISQPYIVAYMTEQLRPQPDDRVLEIGTGSGYQAAVLAEIVAEVFTIEIVAPLAEQARGRLRKEMDYDNVSVRHGDGYHGWPEAAPFDAIIVTAASESIPPPLVEQLEDGGRMIIPVGPALGAQHLILVTKTDGKVRTRTLLPVRFVPFTRER